MQNNVLVGQCSRADLASGSVSSHIGGRNKFDIRMKTICETFAPFTAPLYGPISMIGQRFQARWGLGLC